MTVLFTLILLPGQQETAPVPLLGDTDAAGRVCMFMLLGLAELMFRYLP